MTVAVVGGGLAGGAAACRLAQAGQEVVLFEREAGAHDKVCGEFLSGEAAEYLAQLGIDLPILGAVPIRAVRLVHGATVAASALPFPAWGLSRRVLDQALLARAASLGAAVQRGRGVKAAEGGTLRVEGVGPVSPRAVLLATGKHDLRGARRHLHRPPAALIGLKMYYRLDPAQAAALAGHVEVVLFRDGGYAGLQMVEGGRANLCVLTPRDRHGGDWPGLVASFCRESPHMAERLAGAHPLLDRPPAVARVPYGFVHQPGPADAPGLYRLGDQAGVIPSFCGDGMAIALHSAFLASASVLRGEGADAYHRRINRDVSGQIGRAGLLHRLGQAMPGTLVSMARAWPGGLRLAARATRVARARLVA